MSPVAGKPSSDIAKMQQVKRAAMAPLNPSGADRVSLRRKRRSTGKPGPQGHGSKGGKDAEQKVPVSIGGVQPCRSGASLRRVWRAKRNEALKKYDYMGDGVPSGAIRDDALKGYARVRPVARPPELQEENLKSLRLQKQQSGDTRRELRCLSSAGPSL